jgi:hypothetical protein
VAKKAAKDKAPPSAAPPGDQRLRLSAHPRAKRHIAAAKGWGGIVGFWLVFYLSQQRGTPTFDAVWHALIAGVGFSMLGWAAAVAVWRQLAVAEVHAARRRANEVAKKIAAEAAERAAEARAAA